MSNPEKIPAYVAHYKKKTDHRPFSLQARFRSTSELGMTISQGVLAGLLRRVLERITSATSLPLSTSPFPTWPRSEKEWWPLK